MGKLIKETSDLQEWNEFDGELSDEQKHQISKEYLQFRYLISEDSFISKNFKTKKFSLPHYLEYIRAGYSFKWLKSKIASYNSYKERKKFNSFNKSFTEYLFDTWVDDNYNY
mgnify:CR=1 FL=1